MIGTESIIIACWVVLAVFWVANALWTKKAKHRQSRAKRLWYMAAMVLSFGLLLNETPGQGLKIPLPQLFISVLPKSAAIDVIAVTLTILGLLLALWSRAVLGRNWSGAVDVKVGHELVTSGPYSLIRHPIYTAWLSMYLGTAIAIGALGGFLGFIVLLIANLIKIGQEEALMAKHFPDVYPGYLKCTKALIPFLF